MTSRPDIELAVAAAVDAESRTGLRWWPGAQMAAVAVRRWSSFARRHAATKHPTTEDRIRDLAKGLQAHFDPEVPFTPGSDWLHLARIMAAVLAEHDSGV